jgi:hypothetical protein
MKPGGIAYVLTPYGFSRAALMDPTHTRAILPSTFGYFAPDENAPFVYDIGYRWDCVYGPVMGYTGPGEALARRDFAFDDVLQGLAKVSELYLNVVSEFALGLQVRKDANQPELG